MSFFFPGEVSFPVDFVCPHCDEIMPIVDGKVILCDCPKSRLVEAAERERNRAFHRQTQQRPVRRLVRGEPAISLKEAITGEKDV